MKKIYLVVLLLLISAAAFSQKRAYRLFKANGSETSYDKLLKASVKADAVLFGELHNNPVCHWLQLELAMDMHEEGSKELLLGAEMFERDNQVLVEEYLQGLISERSFEGQARLWPNYGTDYKPLLGFAKKESVPFLATNIPRRYAAIVARKGFEGLDSLSKEAYNWIAPLPIPYDPDLPGYKKMNTMMSMHGKSNPNLPKAQAIKDATMANSIISRLAPGKVFLHFNGTYHSNNYEGISWYINKYRPETRIITIATVEQDDIDKLADDNKDMADFILVIPTNMTKTY